MANILKQADLERINQELLRLQEAEQDIKQAQIAGIDIGDQMDRVRETRQKLLKLKQAYFPGK